MALTALATVGLELVKGDFWVVRTSIMTATATELHVLEDSIGFDLVPSFYKNLYK